MNTAIKLLAAMQANPGSDWTLANLQTIAKKHDVVWTHEGGSHCIFRRADGAKLSIPARRPIKPVYIRQFVVWVKGE